MSTECLSDLSIDHSPVLIKLIRQTESVDPPIRLTSHKTSWLRYRIYISSHIELKPLLDVEADIDSFVSTLESVFVTAARISTHQTTQALHNQKKINLQIEQLVHEKRRVRR